MGAKSKECDGYWKDSQFMKAPYITSDDVSITASVTADAVRHDACIYQHTFESCRFFLGDNGVSQLEFDYEITGDRSNWFAFWLDPNKGHANKSVPDAEILPLE